MDKILFYTNEWDDVTEFIKIINFIEQSGIEVAFSTDNRLLIRLLSVGKLLVVNQKTYYSDVTVYRTNKPKEFEGILMSWDELDEVFDE